MKTKQFLLCIMALLLSVTAMSQTTYYVSPDGSDTNGGSSWEDAKATIAGALSVASSGSQIFVQQGTYTLTATLTMKDGVNVYGGFVGSEATLEERPVLKFGKAADGKASVLNANASSATRRVLTQSANDFSQVTTWDGFVITNGNEANGGGVILRANGILNNCTVTGNKAQYGGGVHCYKDADVSNCKITDNVATATGESVAAKGGGVYLTDGSRTINCIIINNSAKTEGGGVYSGKQKIDNIAGATGTAVINCLVANNTAVDGGGVYASAADITSCTIVNNIGSTRGGGITVYGGLPVITNCIIWGNTGTGGQINGSPSAEGNTKAVVNSAVQGTYGGNGKVSYMELSTDNNGSSSSNYPRFKQPSAYKGYRTDAAEIADALAADWRITDASSCKNMGTESVTVTLNNSQGLSIPALDIKGNLRTIDGTIDMGAYEVAPDFVIDADDSRSVAEYTNEYGDILFYSDDDETGQLTGIPAKGLAVHGVVQFLKTFTPAVWYPVGFPFEVQHIHGDFSQTSHSNIAPDYDLSIYNGSTGDIWVKSYDGSRFEYSSTVDAGAGYIFQFPTAFNGVEVTFISGNDVIPANAEVEEPSDGYQLAVNPGYENRVTEDDRYYTYDSGENAFTLAANGSIIRPFEAFILAAPSAERVQSISISGEITGLENSTAGAVNDRLLDTRYYNLQGVEIQQPLRNRIYMVKKIYASQRTEVTKVLYNK